MGLKRSDANGGTGQGMCLPCGWIWVYGPSEAYGNAYKDGKGVRAGHWCGKRITGAASGTLDGRARFPEAAVATWIRQAYRGALVCENAYGPVIALRI